MNNRYLTTATLLLCLYVVATPAAAATPRLTLNLSGETRDFGEDRGSLDTITLEYKIEDGDTTVLLTPTIGNRRGDGASVTAGGFDGAIYQRWNDVISTRSELFVAENEPVFAHLDFAQDVTVKVARNTTVTVGARWAKYSGGRDVAFQSLGVRQYFKGGSASYRLMRINPDNRKAFYGHLLNFSIYDVEGAGKTQLWLSAGAASFDRVQPEDNVSGDDYSVVFQRFQAPFLQPGFYFGRLFETESTGLVTFSEGEKPQYREVG